MTTGIIKRNGQSNQPAAPFTGMVERVFQNNLNRFFEDSLWGFNGVEQHNNVPVNIRETDGAYELQLIAPGLKKENFKVSLEGDLLTVSFENKENNNNEKKNDYWITREHRMQSFSRSFTVDNSLDVNGITAEYKDGLLYLTLPKKEGAQRLFKNIEIK
jgi:HSP20 family protein